MDPILIVVIASVFIAIAVLAYLILNFNRGTGKDAPESSDQGQRIEDYQRPYELTVGQGIKLGFGFTIGAFLASFIFLLFFGALINAFIMQMITGQPAF